MAVLDAVIELFSEDLDPGPEEVAVRSGLSPRSVYRYFEDRDALIHAAIDRQQERVLPLLVIHEFGTGSLDVRIDRLVHARMRLYEAIAPTARAARLRSRRSPIVAANVEATRRVLRQQVEGQFAVELEAMTTNDRRSKSAAADVLCQFETLDYYRVHRGFSSSATKSTTIDALHCLFDPGTRDGTLAGRNRRRHRRSRTTDAN